MGLIHPSDLAAWRRWRERCEPLAHRLMKALRPQRPEPLRLLARGPEPRLLVVIEQELPASVATNLRVLQHMACYDMAVLTPRGLHPDSLEHSGPWEEVEPGGLERLPERLRGLRAVLASGSVQPAGELALRWARRLDIPFLVVQHGFLTPHAPPLPSGATLLAFSEEDGEFWRSGRDDLEVEVIGSQLFWDAATAPPRRIETAGPPVFLGQLHVADLPHKPQLERAIDFCRRTGASYRPHPAELDRRSRAGHRQIAAAGIAIDDRPLPLAELARPVVSAYSTGIMEAAARGMPAWVSYPDPPDWLRELWQRYHLAPYGAEPTRPPEQPEAEPLRAAAHLIRRTIGTETIGAEI